MINLPWFSGYRPGQLEAIERVVEAFHSGARVVYLDAPTGSGKTLIAEAVRERINGDGLYLCTTKSLQTQFMESFAYAKEIRGRANYPCSGREDQFPLVNTSLCTRRGPEAPCQFCKSACPYQEAKEEALDADLVCTNTAYALAMWNSPRPAFNNRGLCVVDEADTLESELMRHAEIRIPNYVLKQARLDPPKHVTTEAGLKDSRWQDWLAAAYEAVSTLYRKTPPSSPKQIARRKSLERLRTRLTQRLDDNWALVDEDGVVFKPFRVDHLAPKMAFSSAHRYLLMSGTILSGEQMSDDLGVSEWALIEMPSTFPAHRRPIIVTPAGNMSRKTMDADLPGLARKIASIMMQFPTERILVHTVSYALAQRLRGLIASPRGMVYTQSADRQRALESFTRTPGAVLFASSFDRGVDLPHDLCRIQITAKVPFPNLGDRLVSSRLRSSGGGGWYDMQTARSLIQSFGRGMRSADDWAITYILDSQFARFYSKARHLFPRYVREALDFSGGIDSFDAVQALTKEAASAH